MLERSWTCFQGPLGPGDVVTSPRPPTHLWLLLLAARDRHAPNTLPAFDNPHHRSRAAPIHPTRQARAVLQGGRGGPEVRAKPEAGSALPAPACPHSPCQHC